MESATEHTEDTENMIFAMKPLQLIFAKPRRLVSFLSVLCVLCGNLLAQDWKTVHDGVEYARVEHKIGNDPVKINLLRLDLRKVRLDVHHALDKAIGLETTSSIAKRKGAVAAINAGFFRLDKSEFAGDPSGILVIDGELYSDNANDRVALVIMNDKHYTSGIHFHRVKSEPSIWPVLVAPRPEIHGMNRERKKGETILYSWHFGRTTLTSASGTEILLQGCGSNTCRDFRVLNGVNNTVIPEKGYVLSIDTEQNNAQKTFIESLGKISAKMDRCFLIEHHTEPMAYLYDWRNPELDVFGRIPCKGKKTINNIDIVSGVPQLIKNGKIDITWEQEKASKSFVETRHPRTAVAKLKDGKFLMVTVDGRQPGVSVGMTLQELAEYILSLDATDAMNLDGGGSTTMFLDGKVVNTPSDKEGERKIGDAIVVTLRQKRK